MAVFREDPYSAFNFVGVINEFSHRLVGLNGTVACRTCRRSGNSVC